MTELGESVNVAIVKIDPDKYLKAEVIEVSFNNTYKACRSLDVIKAPHWPAGKPDGHRKSKKAAVLQMGKDKTCTAKIKVKIESKGLSGNGAFKGTLNNLVFEGQIPLASGEPEVTVTLKETPDSLRWVRGTMVWEINGGELDAVAGTTRVELFFVFDDPAKNKFFKSKGVWIEALRFIFEKAGLEGTRKIKDGLGKVTKCCFELPYHAYEILEGERQFGGASGKFNLSKYMKPPPNGKITKEYNVNCYDQTYAVITFSGALGLETRGVFLMPFGYLKETMLTGRGLCNNPFPTDKYEDVLEDYQIDMRENGMSKLKPPKLEDFLCLADCTDQHRAPFGNHMFCEFTKHIYDACAGPSTGSADRLGYLKAAIDTTTPSNNFRYPKSNTDIENNAMDKTKIEYIDKLNYEVKSVE